MSTNTSGRPRVVLIEDDESLRRFVQLALEELDIDLISCGRLSEALHALEDAPAQLVVTDLMLAGESGLTLIERLAHDDALRAGAKVVVFSAGVTPAMRERLLALHVWRILPKPLALRELERCVEEALAGSIEPAPQAVYAEPVDEADVVARHFNGDAALYRAFRDSCVAQFVFDAQVGEAACAARDAQGLRRIAHNLKTVLRSLVTAAWRTLQAAWKTSPPQGTLLAHVPSGRCCGTAFNGSTRTHPADAPGASIQFPKS